MAVGDERRPDRINARHVKRIEEERRALKNLGPLLTLEPATVNRPSKSPNGACQAGIHFGQLQVPKESFPFVDVSVSVRSNGVALLQRKLASHTPQGGEGMGYALFDTERRALVLILLSHECSGPPLPPDSLAAEGMCVGRAHTMVLAEPVAKQDRLAVCFDPPAAAGPRAPR
jgi:hypothetical protein